MIAFLLEVMDKEPTVTEIWLIFLIVGIVGFFLCRYRAWLIAPVFILIICFAPILMPDNDEFVQRAILEEAGANYYRYSYPAILIAIVLPAIGMLFNVRSERKKQETK